MVRAAKPTFTRLRKAATYMARISGTSRKAARRRIASASLCVASMTSFAPICHNSSRLRRHLAVTSSPGCPDGRGGRKPVFVFKLGTTSASLVPITSSSFRSAAPEPKLAALRDSNFEGLPHEEARCRRHRTDRAGRRRRPGRPPPPPPRLRGPPSSPGLSLALKPASRLQNQGVEALTAFAPCFFWPWAGRPTGFFWLPCPLRPFSL